MKAAAFLRPVALRPMDDADQYRVLQDQLDHRFNEQRAELDRRFAYHDATMDRRLTDTDKKIDHLENIVQDQVDRRFDDLKVQTELSREAMEKRLDAMNEFRDQLRDQASKFISRDELNLITAHNEESYSRNADAIQRLASRIDLMQGRDSGSTNYRTERRLDVGQVVQIAVMLIMATSLILLVLHRGG